MVNIITQSEKNSLLYYQGAVGQIKLDEPCYYLKEFYKVPNAYEMINTLLFPGIENEKVRIMEEGRMLQIDMLNYMPELLEIYCNIYSAMCKYTLSQVDEGRVHTWRKDRMNTLGFMEAGHTHCFLSTALTDGINPYFHLKAGILLLEIESSKQIEHIDMNEVLGGDSAYPDEDEILFAPFLRFEKIKLELNEKEKAFLDINGEAPKGKYLIRINGSMIEVGDSLEDIKVQGLYDEIIEPKAVENAKAVFRMLQLGEVPEEEVCARYDYWKKAIHMYLRLKYAEIKREILHIYCDLKNQPAQE